MDKKWTKSAMQIQINHLNSWHYTLLKLSHGDIMYKLVQKISISNYIFNKLSKTFDSWTYFIKINQPNTRQTNHAYCLRYRTTYTSLVPLHQLPRIWNDLEDDMRNIKYLSKFNASIRSAKLNKYVDSVKCENTRCRQCFPGLEACGQHN